MSNAHESKKQFKYFFLLTAMIIAVASVWITNTLINELKEEERKKIETWAEAVQLLSKELPPENIDQSIFNDYYDFLSKIIEGNTTIPAILTSDSGEIETFTNIELSDKDDPSVLKKKIAQFSRSRDPITIKLYEGTNQYLYYDDSTVLKQLRVFPYIQLIVLFVFIAVSFLALSSTQKAEQNKVWVGLSKETAHQLGTPISSLMAWMEYFKAKNLDSSLLEEMDKDVQRLRIIAERFSKIGANPEPKPINLHQAVQEAISYLGKRISSKVSISIEAQDESALVLMNDSLFGWAIENLIKNAVDAMDGQGKITINTHEKGKKILLDISDTGKGIPKSKFDTVFHPGYTTKKRGWGLGLSLVKRIIENYSNGKIYVYKSELGKGTTFRIELKKHISE